MKAFRLIAFLALNFLAFAAGCVNNAPTPPPPDKEAKIETGLEQLDPADQKLAEEQRFCAIKTESRLGSMGKPIKLTLKDQTVFLCCKSCEKQAKADPDKTLAAVKKLKAHNASEKKE